MKNKLNWLEAALLIAPLLILVAFWKELPPRVPIHWNLRGEVDGWASKGIGMLIMPLTSFGIVVLLRVLPWFDPKLRSTAGAHGGMNRALQILRLALAAFFVALFCMQVAGALGHTVASGRFVLSSTLLLLAIIGNYLSNLRPNYFAGIRTPWTLENPETWRATHRMGGRIVCFGSLALLLLQFLVSESTFGVLFVSSIVLLLAWGYWYSWRHFRTHGASRNPAAS